MAAPKRTQIADEIVERLRGVFRGQGYRTDLGRQGGKYVGRRVLVLSTMQDGQFPSSAVLMAPGEPEPGCMGSFREQVHVGVLLYAKSADIPEELERLEADALKAICGGGVLAATGSPPVWVSSRPFYNEVEQVDRGMVLVTFAAQCDRTPDSA